MTSRRIFDFPSKKREIAAIEQESIAPDFYSDRARSQRQMRRLSYLRDEVTTWEGLSTRLSDLEELSQMVAEEPDERLSAEIAREVAAAETEMEK
ncbi:MAG TPA: PCRF domain-containing protein, partial [Ktedonobacterales bacterium]